MRKRLGFAVLAASLVCGGAHATATYPAIYSFGDSLSDVGNALAASSAVGDPIPLPSFYYNGRFSNGPNWLDDLSAKLGLSMSPALSFPPGNDFAFGGAQTGETIVNQPVVGGQTAPIGLTDQVASFKTVDPSPTPGALYTLDIGGNDMLNALTGVKNGSISLSDLTTTFLNQAVGNTVGAVADLYNDGMRSLLYYEVPDLSVVPDFAALGSTLSAEGRTLALDFNTDVLDEVKALNLPGLTVFDVPVFSTLDQIVANPSAFGFTNVTSPCFSGGVSTSGSVCADPNQSLFWDGEHPTAAANALTADLAFDVLTGAPGDPIDPLTAPEPATWAMMLIGFAGIGLVSWRARLARAAKAESEFAPIAG
jgi:phospholipase/lecithinase/hemolysin